MNCPLPDGMADAEVDDPDGAIVEEPDEFGVIAGEPEVVDPEPVAAGRSVEPEGMVF
jgi:hypothetical protein